MVESRNAKIRISERLRAEQRIRKARDFKFLFDRGKFSKGTLFHLWVYEDKEKRFLGIGPKLGIVVGRKTHNNATVRNLWKRRMREVFRKTQASIKPDAVMLLQSRSSKEVPSYEKMALELKKLLEKTGSLK